MLISRGRRRRIERSRWTGGGGISGVAGMVREFPAAPRAACRSRCGQSILEVGSDPGRSREGEVAIGPMGGRDSVVFELVERVFRNGGGSSEPRGTGAVGGVFVGCAAGFVEADQAVLRRMGGAICEVRRVGAGGFRGETAGYGDSGPGGVVEAGDASVAREAARTGSEGDALRVGGAVANGAGLRLSELIRLRVQDVDVGRGTVTVRLGKGDKDRVTVLPKSLREEVARQIERARMAWAW